MGLKHSNLDLLESTFWDISNPHSPNYGHYMSVPELADLIGAPQSRIDLVSDWLVDLGAIESTIQLSNLRDTLTATFAATPAGFSAKGLPAMADHLRDAVDFVLRRDNAAPAFEARPSVTSDSHPFAYWPVDNAEGNPGSQKISYGLPAGTKANNATTTQMVWGPGTFGYSIDDLEMFKTYYENDLVHSISILLYSKSRTCLHRC